jgi:hypothetical protein
MEQHALKNVSNCLNTNIYSYLETSGCQNYNLYLNVVHFFNTSVNLTYVAAYNSVFMHRDVLRAVLLLNTNILRDIW